MQVTQLFLFNQIYYHYVHKVGNKLRNLYKSEVDQIERSHHRNELGEATSDGGLAFSFLNEFRHLLLGKLWEI